MRLTLDEAIARAEQNSLRRRRASRPGRWRSGRPWTPARPPRVRRSPRSAATPAPTTSTSTRCRCSRSIRSIRTCRTTTARGSICSGRSTPPAGSAALQRAAGAERDAAGFDLQAARLDARLEAARAFWALVTATQAESVVQRALDTLDAHLRDLRSRLDQGLIPPNDVLSAEAQRSHQQVMVIEARNLRQVAKADLRRVDRRRQRPRHRGRSGADGCNAAGTVGGVAPGGARHSGRSAAPSPAASRRRATAKPPSRRWRSRRSRLPAASTRRVPTRGSSRVSTSGTRPGTCP